jgi:hypothetical protein
MTRIIEINFQSKESTFRVNRIERSKLYGSRRRIPIDAHGRECSFASLTEDGRFILPKGSTALLYLDEKGDVVERNQLQVVDADGKIIQKSESGMLEIEKILPVGDLLNFSITNVYQLEPVFVSSNLEESLSQGTMYSLPHFHDNGDENKQAFLFSSDNGYFILSGELTCFDFIGLSETDLSPPDIGEEPFEEIDFSMW